VDSDFNRPLGLDRTRLSTQREVPYRLIAVGGLGCIAAALFGFLSLTGDPMGGEPYAISAIHHVQPASQLPAAQPHGPAETETAMNNSPASTGSLPKRVSSAEDVELQSGVKVVRPGAVAPGALIIKVAPDLSIHLAPAPDPRLVEKTRFGQIPRIGADGARPSEVYARPLVSVPALKAGAPRIAILIGGMGLNAASTKAAIEALPSAVTLGFAPYGHSVETDATAARERGHEIVLQLPMEPFDYPHTNPGPHSLLTSASATENIDQLHWLMSRFTGYAGVANFLGAKFTGDAEALTPILRDIAGRGLYYADDGTSAQSLVNTLAPTLDLATAQPDVIFDASAKPGGLEEALTQLEAKARDKGIAIGIASGLPSELVERIARFAQALEAKGIMLVPLSAAQSKTGTRPLVTRVP
jgi:polysaccharide deacetylase 2 family uncharacterized protein YibQ